MKKVVRGKCILVILLTFSIFAFISCINQHPSNKSRIDTASNTKVKLYENQKDTVPKLKFNSMVLSIFEDSKGNYWFGSDREGVCRYDGKSFTYFSTKDGLRDNQIRTIQEDQQKNIWFATRYGVSKYDGDTITVQTAKNRLTSNLISENSLTPNLISEDNWKKEVTDLWFNGEFEGGIYRHDGESLTILEFPKLDLDHESFSISGTVTGICQGKNNMLWIANYGGVIGYDGESFTFINKRGIDYHVRSIFEDSKGNLWIGNNGIGVLRYSGNTTINFTEENSNNDINGQSGGIISSGGRLNHVFAIAEDRNGYIWFGDRDTGTWRYDGKTIVKYTLKDGLTNVFVRTIYKDKKGDLWFGMEGGSICKFNGESFIELF